MLTRTVVGCTLSRNAGTATVTLSRNPVRAPSTLATDTTSVAVSPSVACIDDIDYVKCMSMLNKSATDLATCFESGAPAYMPREVETAQTAGMPQW